MERDQLAMDLRSDAERELAARLALFRDHMHRDWRDPERYLHEHSEWVPVEELVLGESEYRQVIQVRSGDQRVEDPEGNWIKDGWRDAVRCLRCGEVIMDFDRVINHDLGWLGCPGDRGGGWGGHKFEGPDDMNRGRAELEAFPACATCGHAWGLHTYHLTMPPGIDVRPGAGSTCYTWCGCRHYVAPPGAVTPWGTCPGCWAQPDRCVCIR
jgi:hypothetical protein